ncbi:MAG TPA: hypothetical protein VLB82_02885 [Thermodesulfobacteriota bacterium]|nr:hypothetical protein [Thermodesulfobacteriota bacterium]
MKGTKTKKDLQNLMIRYLTRFGWAKSDAELSAKYWGNIVYKAYKVNPGNY